MNTRLQVEHPCPRRSPASTSCARCSAIAQGEELGSDDPEIRGHSIEFRINAEDGGRNFMPAPGTLSAWEPPQRPGVRLDRDRGEVTGADSIHPGYGFLAENADFAQAVMDAGLIWIGPPPAAIEALGDKAKAKHIADKANAPLAPGTKDPVKDADEVVEFAKANGLPVAIKAVFGGGGRGLKVARTLEEIPDAYESAVREAVTAFGRGECLVEKFLDKPRHVETQCLADQHGNVVVVSTRDCSLQRRNQKLVEEAPAPFLTDEQMTELYESSKRILTEAGYYGAGTCEFLVAQDGTISFLEVNTRLQVEHCVSEEVTGIDLVREMFRIAAGEELGYGDPEVRGHSIEFRINAEDGGRNFMPAPGTLSAWSPPSGPGVRLDGGYENGETIPGSFDSLIAKLIVTGTTRTQALERSRRALDEFVVDGMPTVIPFHRAVVSDPAYVGASTPSRRGRVHRLHPVDRDRVRQPDRALLRRLRGGRGGRRAPEGRRRGRRPPPRGRPPRRARRAVRRWRPRVAPRSPSARPRRPAPPRPATPSPRPCRAPSSRSPSSEGQEVAEGDVVVVMEAMKMEQPLKAHRAGTVTGLQAEVGATVTNGAVICEIKD